MRNYLQRRIRTFTHRNTRTRVGMLVLVASATLLIGAGWRGSCTQYQIEVLSSPPEYVSGDDARVSISVPLTVPIHKTQVSLNGVDVTDSFEDVGYLRQLEGVVTGLALGDNLLEVSGPGHPWAPASLMLTNHPISGPMFSGPQQEVFLCSDAGDRANAELGPAIDADCAVDTVVSFKYMTTGGGWADYDPGAPPPADMAQTTTMDGDTVDYIVRWERGTINRFIYSIAVLSPAEQDTAAPELSAWNGRLIYYFQGGVAIGHYQGDPSRSRMLYDHGLGLGYAVAYSTGTKTGTHYNLELGGETAIMVKDRFVSAYANPDYTVGVGGSGGGIQQYVYGQNHEGLLDAGIPQYSYPDMVTQTIHIGDCELLERWIDVQLLFGNAKWADWENRTEIEGLNALNGFPNDYAGPDSLAAPGLERVHQRLAGPVAARAQLELRHGARHLAAGPVQHRVDPLRRCHQHLRGRGGWLRGQHLGQRRRAVRARGPALRLPRRRRVPRPERERGLVEERARHGAGGVPLPLVPVSQPGGPGRPAADPGRLPQHPRPVELAEHGPVSGRRPDARTAPRGRPDCDRERLWARPRERGDVQIPLIDWRNYLEGDLNMHNSHQSFASRQRLLNYDGDASNQVIWFTDLEEFDQTPMAFEVIEEWMGNIAAHPWNGVAGNKPAAAVDSCFDSEGDLIYAGDDAWAGILDDGPPGPCTQALPVFSTSRIVAGGPITGDVFKCHLISTDDAIAAGFYGPVVFDAAQKAHLDAIFPTGVCDYAQGDARKP